MLSNNKVLRYDCGEEEIYEMEGLEDMEVEDVKVLSGKGQEKYVVLTDECGVIVCTVLKINIIENEKNKQKLE